jgi:hypothetical protein
VKLNNFKILEIIDSRWDYKKKKQVLDYVENVVLEKKLTALEQDQD